MTYALSAEKGGTPTGTATGTTTAVLIWTRTTTTTTTTTSMNSMRAAKGVANWVSDSATDWDDDGVPGRHGG